MSATVTGVCGFSWEVTMAVLPRLYFEEVQSELRRRKIAVGREKVLRHSELIHLLHEIMVCEYEQLQQHLRGNTGSEHSPPTRTQDGASDGQGGHFSGCASSTCTNDQKWAARNNKIPEYACRSLAGTGKSGCENSLGNLGESAKPPGATFRPSPSRSGDLGQNVQLRNAVAT
ncbi:Hypp8913 [Branchiostoma lanceolatum]|uniref:Hypp8913 protein n=1 Tax=Branchiostoma lanceolatum TaxID=7740 RepID=A0A8K0EH49_BRALA|nr:Hypp8913 [Branchiostoma lanceolatum]